MNAAGAAQGVGVVHMGRDHPRLADHEHDVGLAGVERAPGLLGRAGEGEYSAPWQSGFADLSGAASDEARVRFAVMASAEALTIYAEMPCVPDDQDEDTADFLGLVVESTGSIYWLKAYRTGEVSATIIDDDGVYREWNSGYRTATSVTDSGWTIEVSLDRGTMSLDGDRVSAHVYRVHGQDVSTWAWPLDLNRYTMGVIDLSQATTR